MAPLQLIKPAIINDEWLEPLLHKPYIGRMKSVHCLVWGSQGWDPPFRLWGPCPHLWLAGWWWEEQLRYQGMRDHQYMGQPSERSWPPWESSSASANFICNDSAPPTQEITDTRSCDGGQEEDKVKDTLPLCKQCTADEAWWYWNLVMMFNNMGLSPYYQF